MIFFFKGKVVEDDMDRFDEYTEEEKSSEEWNWEDGRSRYVAFSTPDWWIRACQRCQETRSQKFVPTNFFSTGWCEYLSDMPWTGQISVFDIMNNSNVEWFPKKHWSLSMKYSLATFTTDWQLSLSPEPRNKISQLCFCRTQLTSMWSSWYKSIVRWCRVKLSLITLV